MNLKDIFSFKKKTSLRPESDNGFTQEMINFLNSQESNISSFGAIHIGFFESEVGVSFYVTGASHGDADSDDHCYNEDFPLSLNRYWQIKLPKIDPFVFAELINNELEIALEENKLSYSYQNAKLLSCGWDDGDINYIIQ